MAQDSSDYQFTAAAPIASSGLDIDALLAGDPDELSKADAAGIPLRGATNMPLSPAAANLPSPSGTAANQRPPGLLSALTGGKGIASTVENKMVPGRAAAPVPTPDDGTRGMMPNFGSNLAQSQVPANNAPATPGETSTSPSVPAAVTPSGNAEDPNQAGIDRAGTRAENFSSQLAAAPTLQQSLAPIEEQRRAIAAPILPNDPNHPEYRPTAGQRIIRGIQAFGRSGIRGVLDPSINGGTPYGAPTRAFSLAAQKQAGQLANIDQQESLAQKEFTEDTGRAKDIITSINDIGKNYAAGETAKSREDVAQARKETADVQGQLAGIKQQVADYQNGNKVPTTYEATIAAAHLEKDPVKAKALEAAGREMAETEARKFRLAAGAASSPFRQSMIDAATEQVKALQDKYDYDPKRNQYVNHDNVNDFLSPNEFTDKKNEIATKLDQQLEQKKMAKLGVRFNPADAGANKPTGRAAQRAAANKPKAPTPTAPAPQGAADMALGSDGQYHYRDGNKRDLGVVK